MLGEAISCAGGAFDCSAVDGCREFVLDVQLQSLDAVDLDLKGRSPRRLKAPRAPSHFESCTRLVQRRCSDQSDQPLR
jgi:hypothetical protein